MMMNVNPFTLGIFLGLLSGVAITLVVIFLLALIVGGKKK